MALHMMSGGNRIAFVRKAAPTVTAGVSYVTDAELTLPVSPGTYRLDAVILYDTATDGDMRFRLSAPASTTYVGTPGAGAISITGNASATQTQTPWTEGSPAIAGGVGVGTATHAAPFAMVTVTTAGTLAMEFAQNTTGAGSNLTIQAGSWMTLTKVA